MRGPLRDSCESAGQACDSFLPWRGSRPPWVRPEHCPTWIQFLRPIEMGRMEFSARLLDNSNSGHSRNRVSLVHSASLSWAALPAALLGKTQSSG
jgi:hypothetical protein